MGICRPPEENILFKVGKADNKQDDVAKGSFDAIGI